MFKKIPADEIFSFSEVPPANLANPAKVQADPPKTLATLAALADPFIENAQFSVDLPKDWRIGIGRLEAMERPQSASTHWWNSLMTDSQRFLASDWALRAAELSWDTIELFGCHRESPEARFDAMGLVVAMSGKTHVALSEESARLTPISGDGYLTHRRALTARPEEIICIWEIVGKDQND